MADGGTSASAASSASATPAPASPETVIVGEDIKDRLGTGCDDDTMGVKQGPVTIWCDPEDGKGPLVWVGVKGHEAANKVQAAELRAARKQVAEQKAARKKAEADRRAVEKREAEEAARQAEAKAAQARAERERRAQQQEARQKQQGQDVYYQNCDAARAAGAAPVHKGDPGYAKHLDRDGDGVGCE